MDYFENNEETGAENPVSLSEEQNPDSEEREKRSYQKGMRRGILTGVLSAVLVLLIAFCALVYTGGAGFSSSSASGDAEAVALSTVLDEEALEKIETILEILDTIYYEDITVEELQEGIYAGLADSVDDPYTSYYTVEEQEDLNVQTSGTYSGIGAAITVDSETDQPMISYTYAGSPAEEAGLKQGDLIMEVDGTEITMDTDTSDVASMIRGEAGTSVTVVIERDGEEITLEIVRASIDTPTVESRMLTDEVGYIYIIQFSSVTEEQFLEAYDTLMEEGMTSLVLDLRYDGGGTVSSCVDIMDAILPEGVTLTMVSASGKVTEYTSDAENYIDLPMAVLVNGSTASAAEIVTAALMDYDYATVIGTTTYGKGVYQQSYTLSDGSGIKVTAGLFYSPLGYNYNGVGIEPDIVLEYENTAGEDADYSVETDNQILKAIEVLTEAS